MKWNFLYQIIAASRTPDQGLPSPDSPSLGFLSSTEFVEPPPQKKIPGYATGLRTSVCVCVSECVCNILSFCSTYISGMTYFISVYMLLLFKMLKA